MRITINIGAKLGFIIFRDGITTIQGVVRAGAGGAPRAGTAASEIHPRSKDMTVPSMSNTTTTEMSSKGPETPEPTVPNGNGNGHVTIEGFGALHHEDFGQLHNKEDAQVQQHHEENASHSEACPGTNNIGQDQPYQSRSRRGSISSLPSSSLEFTNDLASTSHSGVTEEMVRWCEKLPLETLVLVEGVVTRPVDNSDGKVKVVTSVEVGEVEVEITKVSLFEHDTYKVDV